MSSSPTALQQPQSKHDEFSFRLTNYFGNFATEAQRFEPGPTGNHAMQQLNKESHQSSPSRWKLNCCSRADSEHRRSVPLLVAAIAVLCFTQHAVAGLILQAESVTIPANSQFPFTGLLDVFFKVSNESPRLAAYNLGLLITPQDSGVSLNAVQQSSASHPAVFAPHALQTFGTGNLLQAADNLAVNQDATINDGAGLVAVEFHAQAGAHGQYQVTFDPNSTFLFAKDESEIPIDGFVGGTITIVPEPSTFLISLMAIASVFSVPRFRGPVRRPRPRRS